MHLPRLAVLVSAAALAACNEGPFIDQRIDSRIDKPIDYVLKSGTVAVCYEDEGQFAEAERLARETCGSYGLEARLMTNLRYQCRVTTPHRATFRCIHPDMVDAAGRPINPFDERAVKQWQARTGKAVPPAVRRNPEAPAPSGETLRPRPPVSSSPTLGAPPPAPVPVQPPAVQPPAVPPPAGRAPAATDVPSWPQPPAPPVPPPAPITAPAASVPAAPDGFTLPVGTWGDAFESE